MNVLNGIYVFFGTKCLYNMSIYVKQLTSCETLIELRIIDDSSKATIKSNANYK